MQHWSALATRNWRVKRTRTAGAVLAIALGTGAVVWVTCCYESVQRTVMEWAETHVGRSHITIQSPLGKYDTLPQRIVGQIEPVEGVRQVVPLLVRRLPSAAERRTAPRPANQRFWTMPDVDFHGLDLERESAIRDWSERLMPGGRMLRAEDDAACVLEQSIAEEQGVGVGDRLLVWRGPFDDQPPFELEIVGVIHRERVARFQKGVALVQLPTLQRISGTFALVNSVEVVLDNPTIENVRLVGARIQAALQGFPQVYMRSSEARMQQINLAQRQQQVVLVLMSCMALLTALFIILSTLSMGMIERLAQLGLLRCVGMTGGQLAVLVVAEVLPLGLLGVALGVPIGLHLTQWTVWAVPEYVGRFAISTWGVGLACGAGLLTTLLAAVLPAVAALGVSPLEATRPRARRTGAHWLVAAAVIAFTLLGVQHLIIGYRVQRDLEFVQWSAAAVVLLYMIYAALAPLLVYIASRLAVPLTARVLGVRAVLLQDQVGHAVWRSAGICCGLMVGLSLIVGLVVFSTSFKTGWQFPSQFPAAYIWSDEQIPGEAAAAALRAVPGVANFTTANAPNVIVEERPLFNEELLKSITWFLGIDPESFFRLIQMEFVEGDRDSAIALLEQGGHVLVAADFARTRKKGVTEIRDPDGRILQSNDVRVWFNNRWTTFKVAGVIDSPALDIAASYFQVQSEAKMAAVGSVIGSNADLRRLFGVDGTRLILLNFDLGAEPIPADWPPPLGSPEGRMLSHMHYNEKIPLERRWQNYRETRVLQEVCRRINAPARYGTATELKDEIDGELTRLTYLLTAVPSMALLVAALGVANLMTANVASRTKQLATLRAVGATRGLVLRLVIGEALVLGVLGSALGLVLGLHLAWNVRTMTLRMWGYELPFAVPWDMVALAVGMTVGLCVLAAIVPARYAARTNVIEALRVA